MSNFLRVPYRWSCWFGFTRNLLWLPYWLKRGIRNTLRWIPVIWNDEDFDWENLAHIMEWKTRTMARRFARHGVATDNKQVSRQLLICAELLKRIRADEIPEPITHNNISRHNIRMREWRCMLGRELARHLTEWWD